MYVTNEGVFLKKFSSIGNLSDFATEYADSIHEATGHVVCIADRDMVIAVAGTAKKEFLNKDINQSVASLMENRKTLLVNSPDIFYPTIEGSEDKLYSINSAVIAPIVSEGDSIGAVILISKEEGVKMGDIELKLAEVMAGFLAKHIEQ